MKSKKCKKCGIEKSISEFNANKRHKVDKQGKKTPYDYYYSCRSCDLIRLKSLDKLYPSRRRVNKDNGEVNWSSYLRKLNNRKKSNIKPKEFKLWLDKQNDECTYCNHSLEDTKQVLKKFTLENWSTKSNKFQIDRKDNKKGYTIDNICFACAICNYHKGDFFTYSEFKEIAKKYIKPKMKEYIQLNIND